MGHRLAHGEDEFHAIRDHLRNNGGNMEFFDGKIHGKYMGNTSKMEVLMGNSMENTRTSHINGGVNGNIIRKYKTTTYK